MKKVAGYGKYLGPAFRTLRSEFRVEVQQIADVYSANADTVQITGP